MREDGIGRPVACVFVGCAFACAPGPIEPIFRFAEALAHREAKPHELK